VEGDCGLLNAVHFTIRNLMLFYQFCILIKHSKVQNLHTLKLNVIRSKIFYSLKNHEFTKLHFIGNLKNQILQKWKRKINKKEN